VCSCNPATWRLGSALNRQINVENDDTILISSISNSCYIDVIYDDILMCYCVRKFGRRLPDTYSRFTIPFTQLSLFADLYIYALVKHLVSK